MGGLLGHAVRFGAPCEVMAAGEGIETMLSLRCALPAMPMAAALSANHLAALLLPPALRRLYIARDADAAGDTALAALIERAEAAGIEALALSPRRGDFNEDLRAFGLRALRAALRIQLAPQDVVRFMRRGTVRTGDITFITAPGAEVWASTNMEAQACLKTSSFPEPLRDIEQRHLPSSGNDIFVHLKELGTRRSDLAKMRQRSTQPCPPSESAGRRAGQHSQIEAVTAIWSQPNGRRCDRSASPKARTRFVSRASPMAALLGMARRTRT